MSDYCVPALFKKYFEELNSIQQFPSKVSWSDWTVIIPLQGYSDISVMSTSLHALQMQMFQVDKHLWSVANIIVTLVG